MHVLCFSWLSDPTELLANSSVLSRAREGKKSFCSHQQDIAKVFTSIKWGLCLLFREQQN